MRKVNFLPLFLCSAGMLALIFDGKTALEGIRVGMELCLNTLVPSLFPFFVLSTLITGSLTGISLAPLRPASRLCRMPTGSESLLLVGILGGYPVGAGNINAAYKSGKLSRTDAQRMAIICNNAGPSFLFGVLGAFFPHVGWLWLLWGIQIAATVITGILLPGGSTSKLILTDAPQVQITDALSRSIKNMALVCGWVMLFRMILEFLNKWVLWKLSKPLQIAVSGLLELSNGCLALSSIGSIGVRFMLAGAFLSLGGVCVWMQAKAVFPDLDLPAYIRGRLLHGLCVVWLSIPVITTLNKCPIKMILATILLTGFVPIFLIPVLRKPKKEVAFYSSMMYNGI